MSKIVLAIAVLLVAVAMATPSNSMLSQWKRFKTQYNKSYPDAKEEAIRFRNFQDNVERAREQNRKSPSAKFGVTKFMDMSVEEFRNQFLMTNPPPLDKKLLQAHYHKKDLSKVNAPTSFNWYNQSPTIVTPVYNQGQCGSCWAFSATETVESVWALAGNSLVELSMQQVVDCDSDCYGCSGGWTYLAYEYLISAGGQDSLASYPYTAETDSCAFNPSNVAATISNWEYVTQSDDETEMVNYLVQNGPLSICVDAEPWMTYQSGVFTADECSDSIDHCVQVVGYNLGASTPYWIVRNSWGTDWGINGFIWLQYGQNTCAMGDVVTSVTAGSN